MAEHFRKHLNGGGAFLVNSSHQTNVLVMDDHNLSRWKRGESFSYHGGFRKMFPTQVHVPHSGYWNLILELPGGARYNVATRG